MIFYIMKIQFYNYKEKDYLLNKQLPRIRKLIIKYLNVAMAMYLNMNYCLIKNLIHNQYGITRTYICSY